MKCPKCHSTKVEKTTLGIVENIGSYAAVVTGIAALKIGFSAMGLRSKTPGLKDIKDMANDIPQQYKCQNCGNVFHG